MSTLTRLLHHLYKMKLSSNVLFRNRISFLSKLNSDFSPGNTEAWIFASNAAELHCRSIPVDGYAADEWRSKSTSSVTHPHYPLSILSFWCKLSTSDCWCVNKWRTIKYMSACVILNAFLKPSLIQLCHNRLLFHFTTLLCFYPIVMFMLYL